MHLLQNFLIKFFQNVKWHLAQQFSNDILNTKFSVYFGSYEL